MCKLQPTDRYRESRLWLSSRPESIIGSMSDSEDYLAMDAEALLSQCDVHTHRSSGPGGQHRDKVSSAVRLRHRPTGITVQSAQSRSQHENKRLAILRLRMNIACRLRRPIDTAQGRIRPVVAEFLGAPGASRLTDRRRLQIGRKDRRFWQVGAFLLDLLDVFEGRLGRTANYLQITTSNLTTVLKSDRHLFATAQVIRKRHGHKPLA